MDTERIAPPDILVNMICRQQLSGYFPETISARIDLLDQNVNLFHFFAPYIYNSHLILLLIYDILYPNKNKL